MGDSARIKVRLKGTRKFNFVRSDGYTTNKVIHAAVWSRESDPLDFARRLLADNEQVEAVRVVDANDNKVWFAAGEPLGPKPEFPFHEYKYLTSIRGDRGTFDVKNLDGRWGHVTSEIYEECHAEAKRAGLRTNSLTIRGSICSIQTNGLKFSQQMNRYVER